MATGGRFHIKFWSLNGRCLISDYPELPTSIKLGTLLCGREAYLSSLVTYFMAGSTSGHIYLWKGRKYNSVLKGHDSGVTCIHDSTNRFVVTGAKDGSIKIWKVSLDGN